MTLLVLILSKLARGAFICRCLLFAVVALLALLRVYLTFETVEAGRAVEALLLASDVVVGTSGALGHIGGTLGAVVTRGADVASGAICRCRRGRLPLAEVARSALACASADAESGQLAEVASRAGLARSVSCL